LEENELTINKDTDIKSALAKHGWSSNGDKFKRLAEFWNEEESLADSISRASIYHNYVIDTNYDDFGEGDWFVTD
jgi:hypothetical protein